MQKILLSLTCAAALFGLTGCDRLKSRDHQNQGVAAFKNAKYQDAVEHFKTALQLDPDSPNAQLYLATTYMAQWIPGAESPENTEFVNHAREEFGKVLQKTPEDRTALQSMAYIAYNQATSLPLEEKLKKFDEATDWNKKLIAVDPTAKEAYYSLAVIAWGKFYPAWNTARASLRMRPEDPGPIKDKKIKEDLKAKYEAAVNDGIQNLQKAIEIDKEYDDAMAYLNLLIREKADLVDSVDDYKKQIEVADGWIQKALDTKKAKAARQPTTGGIVNDTK